MIKHLTLVIALIGLCGCNSAYNAPDYAHSFQAKWAEEDAAVGEASKKCEKDYKAKKISYYATNQCMLRAMEKYELPLLPNRQAFKDYETQRLLLALQVQKGKVSKDEAKLIMSNQYDHMIEAQNATIAGVYAQNAAAQDRQNMVYQKMLGAAAEPLNAQRAWIDQQNQQNRSIHCTNSGATTDCREY